MEVGYHRPTVEMVPGVPEREVSDITIDGTSLLLFSVISGVPQGSILWPLVFLIYINELVPEQVAMDYTSCYLFADDTKLLKAITGVNDELQPQQDL